MKMVRLTRYGMAFGQVMYEDEARKIVNSCKNCVLGLGIVVMRNEQ